MLETIRQDYVRTGRAEGRLSSCCYKHALKCALPVITVIGNDSATSWEGTVLVESGFGIPGLGPDHHVHHSKDIPQTTACILFLASLSNVVIILIVDILYAYIDPSQSQM